MNELKIGQTAERELVVGPEHLACRVGSGSVEVLATPMVAALLEGAASDLAQSALEESETTVGSRLNLEHLAPTPEGMRVQAVAELTEIDGRVLRFSLRAQGTGVYAGEFSLSSGESVALAGTYLFTAVLGEEQ